MATKLEVLGEVADAYRALEDAEVSLNNALSEIKLAMRAIENIPDEAKAIENSEIEEKEK